MATFVVFIPEVHNIRIDVVAEDAEQAKQVAIESLDEMLSEGTPLEIEYSHTLDPDEWSVCDLGNQLSWQLGEDLPEED